MYSQDNLYTSTQLLCKHCISKRMLAFKLAASQGEISYQFNGMMNKRWSNFVQCNFKCMVWRVCVNTYSVAVGNLFVYICSIRRSNKSILEFPLTMFRRTSWIHKTWRGKHKQGTCEMCDMKSKPSVVSMCVGVSEWWENRFQTWLLVEFFFFFLSLTAWLLVLHLQSVSSYRNYPILIVLRWNLILSHDFLYPMPQTIDHCLWIGTTSALWTRPNLNRNFRD